ncbi:MAG: 2-amino-4-hydroxy-6-hydroxymethyldihydropteridine diphosphokinase [Sphingobacteriia bacterium]|nr:2-amino-4-hydroxy-6-hydroxymethyldihydropteridine diphosphokinase [Sphingobacteriia bacterium]NCC39798.1 2-amino-4-hydroxy-6-hydroxymethyldihydropteridine diphosphokinase [Gammaproteobacteria bacterium]
MPSPAHAHHPIATYIALGSNLSQPAKQIRTALTELAGLPETALLGASRLYRTAPVGPPGQPDYVNAVAGLRTRLAPRELLTALQEIEAAHGRRRDGTRWGPRTLDLDILLYGDEQVIEPGLTIPHPELTRRAFVLIPLADIAPLTLLLPGGRTLAELVACCERTGVEPLDSPGPVRATP